MNEGSPRVRSYPPVAIIKVAITTGFGDGDTIFNVKVCGAEISGTGECMTELGNFPAPSVSDAMEAEATTACYSFPLGRFCPSNKIADIPGFFGGSVVADFHTFGCSNNSPSQLHHS